MPLEFEGFRSSLQAARGRHHPLCVDAIPENKHSISHTRHSLTPATLSHPPLSHTRHSLTPATLSHPPLSHTRHAEESRYFCPFTPPSKLPACDASLSPIGASRPSTSVAAAPSFFTPATPGNSTAIFQARSVSLASSLTR
ncbi:hypothetical protein B0T16DRAFT_11436 [Cercophora newfieldiana]|uniref:Uncharacterized protein n=1 Tax=Cercophora newfieldiana TaxID=92897 RepID=A0AA40CXV5_9PEZI|nr:hypothetical protein B0T16DRAFT_11436 [Cercophora newfieldiana]